MVNERSTGPTFPHSQSEKIRGGLPELVAKLAMAFAIRLYSKRVLSVPSLF